MVTKKVKNRADELIFHALKKAVEEGKIHICLINSRINKPSSPVYNPWEVLLPILVPVLIGLILILAVGPLFGLFFMVGLIMVSSTLVKKKLDNLLLDRSKAFLLSNFDNCNKLWDFGGVVLVNAENKNLGCVSPDADWKEFVIRNFSDLMIEKKEDETEKNEKAA